MSHGRLTIWVRTREDSVCNESCERFMSRVNESCHVCRSHVTNNVGTNSRRLGMRGGRESIRAQERERDREGESESTGERERERERERENESEKEKESKIER